MRHILTFLFFASTITTAFTQANLDDLPLERQVTQDVTFEILASDSAQHTAFKPYWRRSVETDSLPTYFTKDRRYFTEFEFHFHSAHLINVDEPGFRLFIDPILDLEWIEDFSDNSAYQDTLRLYNNTRGFRLAGQIGEYVSFQSSLLENQGFYPMYYKTRADSFLVIPGQGRWKPFDNNGFDFSNAFGKVSIDLGKWGIASIGNQRFFIGNGHRSMLLSDGAFNAPYLEWRWIGLEGKLLISKTLMSMQTLQRLPLGEVPESLFKRKSLSFHYINWLPVKGIEIGLFEGVMWERFNSEDGGTQPLPWQSVISIPGSQSAIVGFNDSNNQLILGANLHLHLNEKLRGYGQVVTTNPGNNSFGYQSGIIADELLPGIRFQAEYNIAKATTYEHADSLQNFSHNNDALAHPLGNDFEEVLFSVDHRIKRFWSTWKFHYQKFHAQDAYFRSIDPKITGGETERFIIDAKIGYTINPKMRWQILSGIRYFSDQPGLGTEETTWFYLGLRMAFLNKYYDF